MKTKYIQESMSYTAENTTGLTMQYLLSYPEDIAVEEHLALIVFLHGAGERGSDLQRVKVHGIPQMLDEGLPVRSVVLAPQLPNNQYVWNNVPHELMALIRQTVERCHADPDRVSVTGLSMGGYGTWEMGLSYPGEFSALAPICGGGMPWRADALKAMPIRAYHGDADDVVPVVNTLQMVDAVQNCGNTEVECILLHGIGHDSWTFAYRHTDLLEWLISQRRKN